MKHLTLAIAAIAGSLLFAGAATADGSLKDAGAAPLAEAGRCVGGAFSGAYLGGHIGFGRLRSEEQGQGPVAPISESDGSFTIGEHSGYNVQCGRVLFGVESEFNYFGPNNEFDCGGCGQSVSSDMNWFGTLRGRLGLVRDDNLLIYATGGLAYAKVDHSFSDPLIPFSQSDKSTEFGWVVGGGLEFMRDAHWSMRAEALYIDLGSQSETYTQTGPCVVCTTSIDYNDNFWIARIGLTYHFGIREAEVAPLK